MRRIMNCFFVHFESIDCFLCFWKEIHFSLFQSISSCISINIRLAKHVKRILKLYFRLKRLDFKKISWNDERIDIICFEYSKSIFFFLFYWNKTINVYCKENRFFLHDFVEKNKIHANEIKIENCKYCASSESDKSL